MITPYFHVRCTLVISARTYHIYIYIHMEATERRLTSLCIILTVQKGIVSVIGYESFIFRL